MKIVVAPASFKGTFSSAEAGALMVSSIRAVRPRTDVVAVPVSDGGEGFADCLLARFGGSRIPVCVPGPRGSALAADFALLPDRTAVIELAAVAGLRHAGDSPDPSTATTAGAGTLLLAAAAAGARRILIGLGGSATNDAGCGLAAAIGVRFLDAAGNTFVPVGKTLENIVAIDDSGIPAVLRHIPVEVACDVRNPLSGPSGAACVFARQKGADDATIALLDGNLRHYSALLSSRYGFDAEFPGAGAAGGTTVALRMFLHADILSGIDTVLDLLAFDESLARADFVFTGEGRFDSQSPGGKAISGIARRAGARHIPCVAFCGLAEEFPVSMYPPGLTKVVPLFPAPVSAEIARAQTPERLEAAIAAVLTEA
jgi:glycerate kinase